MTQLISQLKSHFICCDWLQTFRKHVCLFTMNYKNWMNQFYAYSQVSPLCLEGGNLDNRSK